MHRAALAPLTHALPVPLGRAILQAFECEDLRGKKRCHKLDSCQCLSGDFQLAAKNNGVRIVKETQSTLTPEQVFNGDKGIPPLFKREMCFDGFSFNMRMCYPHEEDCENFKSCEPGDGNTCYHLQPVLA